MTVEALPRLEIVEAIETVAPCEGSDLRPECDTPATWLQTAMCETPGCPDEHYTYCSACMAVWREREHRHLDEDTCGWCKLTSLTYGWEPL